MHYVQGKGLIGLPVFQIIHVVVLQPLKYKGLAVLCQEFKAIDHVKLVHGYLLTFV